MGKLGKWTLIAMAGAGVIVGFLIVIFIVDMTPDAGKEEEVKEKAGAYLDAHFSGQMEMYDTLYDNMGNFHGFDYAAKVRNTTNGVDFTVYEDAASKEMVDTYAVNYFEDELSDLIMEDVEKRFTEIEMVMVSYADPAVTDKYIGETDLPAIQELDAAPSVSIWVNRERKPVDERSVDELLDILKNDLKLPHAQVMVQYQAEEEEGILTKEY
ncbi:hypothetical protein M662_16045 [Bacillus sp. SB49]|uniref:hypothetical protein n=1 Tax=Bacillus sp. SB49 TaxID=1071080 RepID=UPI0004194F93|nr:hypothetical protein [Bacillus sp. SB49]QHT47930.1 hypothetical protein M662_16045 [Bacillus sp. SB49]